MFGLFSNISSVILVISTIFFGKGLSKEINCSNLLPLLSTAAISIILFWKILNPVVSRS